MSTIKRIILCALCMALAVVLPLAFHAIPRGGNIFSPMHIPVLLAGLVCGPSYGLICGILSPLLSSVITGMPSGAYVPSMMCELAVYGLIAGLMTRVLKNANPKLRLFLSQCTAMLLGRIAYGILNALIFRAGDYSLQIWLTSAFISGLPGIILHLVTVPLLITALRRSGYWNEG